MNRIEAEIICEVIALLRQAKARTLVHKNALIQEALDKLNGLLDDEKPPGPDE